MAHLIVTFESCNAAAHLKLPQLIVEVTLSAEGRWRWLQIPPSPSTLRKHKQNQETMVTRFPPGRQKSHIITPPPFALELNTQNMHCTRFGLLYQVTHSYLKVNSLQQEEELELELAQAIPCKSAPIVPCWSSTDLKVNIQRKKLCLASCAWVGAQGFWGGSLIRERETERERERERDRLNLIEGQTGARQKSCKLRQHFFWRGGTALANTCYMSYHGC